MKTKNLITASILLIILSLFSCTSMYEKEEIRHVTPTTIDSSDLYIVEDSLNPQYSIILRNNTGWLYPTQIGGCPLAMRAIGGLNNTFTPLNGMYMGNHCDSIGVVPSLFDCWIEIRVFWQGRLNTFYTFRGFYPKYIINLRTVSPDTAMSPLVYKEDQFLMNGVTEMYEFNDTLVSVQGLYNTSYVIGNPVYRDTFIRLR